MIPLARELLRMGSEVVMVANSLPAINDVTCAELRTLLESLCEVCPVLKVIAPDIPPTHGTACTGPQSLRWAAMSTHCTALKVMPLSRNRL